MIFYYKQISIRVFNTFFVKVYICGFKGSFKSANHKKCWVLKLLTRKMSHLRKVRKSNKLLKIAHLWEAVNAIQNMYWSCSAAVQFAKSGMMQDSSLSSFALCHLHPITSSPLAHDTWWHNILVHHVDQYYTLSLMPTMNVLCGRAGEGLGGHLITQKHGPNNFKDAKP